MTLTCLEGYAISQTYIAEKLANYLNPLEVRHGKPRRIQVILDI